MQLSFSVEAYRILLSGERTKVLTMSVGRSILSRIFPCTESMTSTVCGQTPRYISCVPAPAVGAEAARLAAAQSERPRKAKTERMKFLQVKMLRKDDVHVAPIFGGGSALAGPVGRVVEMVRNLGGPGAGCVGIVDIAFHGLAQSGCPSGRVGLPSGRKDDGASHGNVDLWRGRARSLQGND